MPRKNCEGIRMLVAERYSYETARDYALRTLRNNIIILELEPGSMVSENELAKELGISRTPTREALIELSKSQIVDIFPQKGSYISLIDYNIVDEAMFLRLVLESAIIKQACDMATPEDLTVLEANVKLQQFYLESGSENKIFDLDNEFHKKLFHICNKDRSYELMSIMMVHFDRVRIMTLSNLEEAKYIVEDHRKLLKFVQNKDKESAEHLIQKHLTRYKIDEDLIRNKYPTYFKD